MSCLDRNHSRGIGGWRTYEEVSVDVPVVQIFGIDVLLHLLELRGTEVNDE